MAIQLVPIWNELIPNVLTIFFTVASLILAVVVTAFVRRHQFMKRWEKIPGPPAQIPLFGSFNELFVKPEEMVPHFHNIYKKWSKDSLLRIWIGPLPLLFLGTAETAEVVLSSNKIIDKSREYGFIQPWLGTGLLTSTGSKWHRRRKLLTPTFHFKILEDFVHVFNEQSKILIDKLTETMGKTGSDKLDVFPFITLCTLDVICETAMGRHVDAQNQIDSDYVKAVYKMAHIIQSRQTQPWLQLDLMFNMFSMGSEQKRCLSILHGFTDKVIRERKLEHQRNKKTDQVKEPQMANKDDDDDHISKKRRLAFLDLLIEASEDGKVLSDLDIREEVDTFMFEGHDTTAAAITFTLYWIGTDPQVQEQVNEELNRVFGGSDRPITMADLTQLKYLECCIKEALRLCPSVPIFSRHLMEDLKIAGYEIPAGATVIVTPALIHRDEKYFPDPETFRPDRFLPENCRDRHPYAYVPFSAGPRNCIGQKFALMEEKVILASVLRHFHIQSLEKQENIVILAELILRPRDGIRLRLTPKKSATSPVP